MNHVGNGDNAFELHSADIVMSEVENLAPEQVHESMKQQSSDVEVENDQIHRLVSDSLVLSDIENSIQNDLISQFSSDVELLSENENSVRYDFASLTVKTK